VTESSRRLRAVVALLGTAAIWGATFVMVKDAVSRYPLYAFLTLRFVIAVIAFAVLFPRAVRRLETQTVRVGVLAGAFLCAGYVFQTWGLQDTTASKAAFITGMFVVITPIMQAVVLRSVPRAATLAGVVLAVVGLWMLSGASANGWTQGDTRVFMCAVAYAAHMIVLGSVGRDHDPVSLTFVQLSVVAVVCGAISFATEPIALPNEGSVWIALGVTGVLASAVAFGAQTWAQRHISPTKTALVLIMEPVFGGLFGWWAGDVFGVGGLVGSALIVGGMVLSELRALAPQRDERVVVANAPEGPPVPLLESEGGGTSATPTGRPPSGSDPA